MSIAMTTTNGIFNLQPMTEKLNLEAPEGYKLMSANAARDAWDPGDKEAVFYAIPLKGLHPVKWYDIDAGEWRNLDYTGVESLTGYTP